MIGFWRCACWLTGLAAAGLVLAMGVAPVVADVVTDRFRPVAAVSTAVVDHSDYDAVLKAHVKPHADGVNRVDFASLKRDGSERISRYVARLETIDPAQLPRNEFIAYWINLYNAKTIEIVLSRYPLRSIREISLPDANGSPGDGPWSAPTLRVKDTKLSLDDIEKKILMPLFADFRLHYALNCLSIGCPELRAAAYTSGRLDAELDEAATSFINHKRGITIEPGRVQASSLFEWYASELGSFADVVAHMRKYARPQLSAKLAELKQIDAYDYDWALIDTDK